MEYMFSDRVSNLKPSAIREIFKYAADPSVVSLSAGNPSPDAFPSKGVIWMDEGHTKVGTHEELLAEVPSYAELCRDQTKGGSNDEK